MPDTRSHRGPHPEDALLFTAATAVVLRVATDDLCWLLSRGYASSGAIKLVGDRYQLAARQRVAVTRVSCSENDRAGQRTRQTGPETLAGRPLLVNGYNVLTTVEAALAGGVILAARDRTYRDVASMHGSFRRVEETRPALELIGRAAADLDISQCVWYLDRPVSNSGRLRTLMVELAAAARWRWTVELVNDPDRILAAADETVATADSIVLDRCKSWFNLAREVITRHVPRTRVLEL